MSDISRGQIKVKGFEDPEMDFQLIRQLGVTPSSAASIGECLLIANQMASESPGDWVQAFEKQATWQKNDGLARLKKNHTVSGKKQLFKASNSFRAAEYYSPLLSTKHQELGQQSADCFISALGCMNLHYETHSIPFENVQLPIYFISPANDGDKRQTLLILSGFDGTLEESFFMNGLAAIERNYNIILFAGPGQMDLFRYYSDTYFIPDYERILTPVIDFFEHREEVDMEKLALLGNSLGGYFATRATAFEPRIKALIANSPIVNLHAYLSSFTGFDPAEMSDDDDFNLDDLNTIPDSEMSEELKARSQQLMIRFGGKSFKNTFKYLKQFNVGEAIHSIHCAVLGLIGTSEGSEPMTQFNSFCDVLNADNYQFTDAQGAGMHCQAGNIDFANAVIFDWLDSV